MEYLLASIAGVLTIPVIFVMATSPVFAMFLVLLGQDLRALGLGHLSISIGQIDITFLDIVYGLLLLAFLVRLAHRGNTNKFELSWIIVGIIGVITFIRGVQIYGIVLAGDVRPTFYFTTAILYFMSVATNRDFLNSVAKLWLLNAVFLSFLAMYLISTVGFIGVGDEVAGLNKRVLHATFAFQILEGAIISLYLWITPGISPHWRHLSLLLLPSIVFMQYRTVWICAIFAFVLAAFYENRLRSRLLAGLLIIAIPATVLMVVLVSSSSGFLINNFSIAASEAFGPNSTLIWRLVGWQALIDQAPSFLDTLIGPPAGSARGTLNSNFLQAHPHSQYLLFFLQSGAIAFFIFSATYVVAVRQLRRSPAPLPGEMLSGRVLFILLAAQMVFYLAYNISYEQYALLGIAIGYLVRIRGTGLMTTRNQLIRGTPAHQSILYPQISLQPPKQT